MTTKQEIIDYINRTAILSGVFPSRNSVLIQMIKDLKPKIEVKKLVWNQYKWQVMEEKNIKTEIGYCNDRDFYFIEECKHGFVVNKNIVLKDSQPKFIATKLLDAIEWVDDKWDEYVLSLVEVSND